MIGARRPRAALLESFVNGRRGLRLGTLFGAPAVFVGRRAAIRLEPDGLAVRLHPSMDSMARAICPRGVVRRRRAWLRLALPRESWLPPAYLALCERAVRDVATA